MPSPGVAEPRRGPRGLFSTLAVAATLSACAGTTPPLEAQAPRYEPDQQTKSQVRANPLEPLIIEWPAAERSRLEGLARQGAVVVRYEGHTMELLPGCRVEGTYAYAGTNVHRDALVITDDEELAASLPLGVASLSGKLQQSGQLHVSLTVVGNYALSADGRELGDDAGCDRATHLITALTAGAFELSAGGSAGAEAAVGVEGLGASAAKSARREVLSRAGDEASCAASSAEDVSPPDGCGALLRVVLDPVSRARPSPEAPLGPVVNEPQPAPPAEEPPPVPPAEDAHASAPPSVPFEPAPSAPSPTPEPESAGESGWFYVGVVVGGLVLGGLVVAGVVVGANQEDAPRGERPSGGLGTVTLSLGPVRW